jgi:hypothetical protein
MPECPQTSTSENQTVSRSSLSARKNWPWPLGALEVGPAGPGWRRSAAHPRQPAGCDSAATDTPSQAADRRSTGGCAGEGGSRPPTGSPGLRRGLAAQPCHHSSAQLPNRRRDRRGSIQVPASSRASVSVRNCSASPFLANTRERSRPSGFVVVELRGFEPLTPCMPCHPHHLTRPSAALLHTASVLPSPDVERGAVVVRHEATRGIVLTTC